ncbi:hypothetical protein AVEN_163503-1 [Araneus ventricosus]|uniref:Histone-lysine N-methyltransferase SETMAR n=1 Tax=Araneus ventricosus TaxID=182803 RepID=A0A4Y2BS89_ARAVE|nr:hypothetical protein AVEN_163503-1 [Araneus ventricosus]
MYGDTFMREGIGMVSFLLHDNTRPHSTRVTQQLIESFGWEQMNHPPHDPVLVPSDFHIFLHLKGFLSGSESFDDLERVKGSVISWLTSQAATFYHVGVQNVVYRQNKCLNVIGD